MFKADSKNNQSCCAVFRAQTRGKLPVFFLRQRAGGYTLVEVMIAVTLTLILMYALAAIFGRVTSMMTQTQDILSMTNNLRTAKDRLREDLENLTVPTLKAPTSQYGFFSYSEGLGNPFAYLDFGNLSRPRYSYSWFKYVSQDDFDDNLSPYGFRGFAPCGNFDRRTATLDTTVGDTDDILSFTVRAPAGKWFRGRCFKELPETYTSDYDASIDDNIEMVESEYAEVIWFLRGATLYRRVLLIVPDDFLEKRLRSLNRYVQNKYPNLVYDFLPSSGYGFYRFFDVSVHYDADREFDCNSLSDPQGYVVQGRLVANTLPDLANRKNRYGYWKSPVISSAQQNGFNFDLGLHGYYGSWYWMRMPTLQESALWTSKPNSPFSFFCAGFPFGRAPLDFSSYEQLPRSDLQYWTGEYLTLGLGYFGPNADNQGYTTKKNNDNSPDSYFLPDSYFIDQWQIPNPWIQQELFSGQLNLSNIVDAGDLKRLNTDVLLTNVLSFDVKVWNEKSQSFVDLGEKVFDEQGETVLDPSSFDPTSPLFSDPCDFRTTGNYGFSAVTETSHRFPFYSNSGNGDVFSSIFYRPVMPAVFDTWTEDYQKEFLTQPLWLTFSGGASTNFFGASSRPGFTVGDIPLDGKVTSSDLPDYPPPYEAEVKVIQVELRAFDPVSRTIKNATVEIKIP